MEQTVLARYHEPGGLTDLEHGSQPLRPTAALMLTGYGFSFPYFPWAWQVAEYRAVAAPMLKPPTPSLTAPTDQKKITMPAPKSTEEPTKKSLEAYCQPAPWTGGSPRGQLRHPGPPHRRARPPRCPPRRTLPQKIAPDGKDDGLVGIHRETLRAGN